jgi:hypothetical protein
LFATIAGCSAMMAMTWCATLAPVLAQSAISPELFSPAPDGDGRLARPFAPRGLAQIYSRDGRSRFGELPGLGSPAASGASATGFDSTNTLRRGSRARGALRERAHGEDGAKAQ